MSLATLQQYNDAKIVLASANDGLYSPSQMQLFLDYATEYLESQCYQQLELKSYTETLPVPSLYVSIDPSKQLNIFLKYFPVTQVTQVAYRLHPQDAFTALDPTAWSFTADKSMITVPFANPIAQGAWAEVQTAYSAGHDEASMPDDLRIACIIVAAHFASMGYAAIDIRSGMIRQVLPRDAMTIVDATINRYQRQF